MEENWESFVEDYLCVRHPADSPEAEAVRFFATHVISKCQIKKRVFDFDHADVVIVAEVEDHETGARIVRKMDVGELPHGTVLYARRNGDAT